MRYKNQMINCLRIGQEFCFDAWNSIARARQVLDLRAADAKYHKEGAY